MGPDRADSSDVRIIREVQAGRVEAFEVLVRKYLRQAQGVAMHLVRNGEDALDLVQESFFKAYRAIGRFDTRQRFFPWFYRILRNTCLTFLKRRNLVRTVSLSAPDEERPDYELVDEHSPSPHEVLERGELREQFWRAFERLSLGDREILALRHFQGLTYQEIADALEIPIGTVMSRLFHARRRLKEKLEPYL